MSIVSGFEEIRFMTELLIAEHILCMAFGKKKENFIMRVVSGFVLLNIISLFYEVLNTMTLDIDYVYKRFIVLSWYLILVLISLIHMYRCYKITISDLLFIGISGYAIQHIEYVLINQILCMGLMPEIKNNFTLYVAICVISTAILYYVIYKLIAVKLRVSNGMIYNDSKGMIIYFFIILVILLTSCFMGQSIFMFGNNDSDNVNYLGAIIGLFNCSLILLVQYSVFHISRLNREKDVINQLLYERQKQYEISKENIEMINRKCHDLKHHISILRECNKVEVVQYIKEVEDAINIYDGVVKTDNEVLNTILSEKSLYCEKHKINLSCIIEGDKLDFMSTLDIYALLGNAIDNAIECVMKYDDKDKRVISLTIEAKGNFLCVQTNNYYEGSVEVIQELPKTTKEDKENHGFGLKSMKYIAEKYSGSLCTSIERDIFILQIVIPIS